VLPGLILSDRARGRSSSASLDIMLDNTMGPRLGDPEDIGKAVAYLMSDDAAFVNGALLRVDGGHSVHQPHLVQFAQLSALTDAGQG
jgi:NAD(P)-dependent dehydrogenase (short-subunit alcohol dehydrogenase family)